jgi:hypothetical protein
MELVKDKLFQGKSLPCIVLPGVLGVIHYFRGTMDAVGLIVGERVGPVGLIIRTVEIALACPYARNFYMKVSVGAFIHANAFALTGQMEDHAILFRRPHPEGAAVVMDDGR